MSEIKKKEEEVILPEFTLGDDDTFTVDMDEEGFKDIPTKEEKVEKVDKEIPSKKEKKVKEVEPEDSFEVDIDELDEEVPSKDKTSYSDEDSEDNEESEVNVFSTLAMTLRESEILSDFTEEELKEVKDEETLIKTINKQITNVVDSTLEDLDSKHSGVISYLMNGGTIEGITKEFKNGYQSVTNYSEDEIREDTDKQKKIAEAYFKKTSPKMSEARLKKAITNAVEIDGEDEIVDMYKELQSLEKEDRERLVQENKKREQEASKRQEEFNQTLYKNVSEVDSFIPGRKIDKKVKDRVYENIKPTLDKVNKDLAKYAPILSYLDYYGLLDGKFDKIIKEAETKQTSSLADVLRRTEGKRFSSKKDNDFDEAEYKRAVKQSLKR